MAIAILHTLAAARNCPEKLCGALLLGRHIAEVPAGGRTPAKFHLSNLHSLSDLIKRILARNLHVYHLHKNNLSV